MKRMNSNRETARIVGVLYLILIFASIAGFFLIEAGLSAPDFLSDVDATKTQVASGVSLELINGIAVIGVAVLMFPLLRKENEALALGYLAFRIMEVVIVVAAIISPLALIAVGQEYAKAGAPDASSIQPIVISEGARDFGRSTDWDLLQPSRSAVLLFAVSNKTRSAIYFDLGPHCSRNGVYRERVGAFRHQL